MVRRRLRLSEPEFTELARTTLEAGISFRFRPSGSSMHPFIKEGDVITISPWPARSPGLGHVVLYLHEQARRLFVHRVTRTGKDYCMTQGDGVNLDDGTTPTSRILGHVTHIERNGKRVRLGLGPERTLLALLSRMGLLSPLAFRAWCCVRPFIT